jgi:hypothetical protein
LPKEKKEATDQKKNNFNLFMSACLILQKERGHKSDIEKKLKPQNADMVCKWRDNDSSLDPHPPSLSTPAPWPVLERSSSLLN